MPPRLIASGIKRAVDEIVIRLESTAYPLLLCPQYFIMATEFENALWYVDIHGVEHIDNIIDGLDAKDTALIFHDLVVSLAVRFDTRSSGFHSGWRLVEVESGSSRDALALLLLSLYAVRASRALPGK